MLAPCAHQTTAIARNGQRSSGRVGRAYTLLSQLDTNTDRPSLESAHDDKASSDTFTERSCRFSLRL